MPVSFKVADHSVTPLPLNSQGLTAEEILAKACPHQYRSAGEIMGSSFAKDAPAARPSLHRRLSKLNPFAKAKRKPPPMDASALIPDILPAHNGLVDTILSAYNKHRNLVLRPDDVWIAILTQLNFYVNANAELLRANFVAHDGKKELKISKQQSRSEMDFGAMSREMLGLMEEFIVDPTLRAWVVPTFSTTTQKDRTVGAIVMMSTLKAYFEYVFESIECGIPHVTLDGTKEDWKDILHRLEKLKEYGLQTIAWYHLLVPVITRFVAAFDAPDSAANVDFWQRVGHYEPGGSGAPGHYYGWISAFCAFDPEGTWIGSTLNDAVELDVDPASLSAKAFWSRYLMYPQAMGRAYDGTPFHGLSRDNIPVSFVEVPVKYLSAPGAEPEPCTMIAGVIGTLVSCSADTPHQMDTVQPVTGWWMFSNRVNPRPEHPW